MDTRAELLIDELLTHPQGQPVDFAHWRERFQSLFREKLDEDSRLSLLQAYAALLDLMERGLAAQGRDPVPFRDARRADWNTLCMQEALHRSGTDLIEPADLNEIVQREIAAGRMEEGDFSSLAEAGSEVLGRDTKPAKPKKGFLSRIFG